MATQTLGKELSNYTTSGMFRNFETHSKNLKEYNIPLNYALVNNVSLKTTGQSAAVGAQYMLSGQQK